MLDLAAESDRLLDFAERARHPAGGFAWLDASGTPDLARPRELLLSPSPAAFARLSISAGRRSSPG